MECPYCNGTLILVRKGVYKHPKRPCIVYKEGRILRASTIKGATERAQKANQNAGRWMREIAEKYD